MNVHAARTHRPADPSGDSQMVQFLGRPTSYTPPSTHVECIETHISWVFLTDRHAYKLKKPVRFEFLDFSTAELRQAACEAEVRLNRRLAPHVYLGVVPITRDQGQLRLGGSGEPVDWLVKMRRLAEDRALDQLIQHGTLKQSDVQQVGQTLTRFYSQLPPLAIRTEEYRRAIESHVRKNRGELLVPRAGLDAITVRRVHESQLRFLRLAPEELDHRVQDGRVVEGHGDLRPEHIYLVPHPLVIDCIEFNAEFRQLDVLDELAFLTVECAALGAEWIGTEVLQQYGQATGDRVSNRLAAFYTSYRGCVRAKVLALRSDQLASRSQQALLSGAARYLRLSDRFSRLVGPPLLLVVHGLTGSGKSTLATRLVDHLDAELLSTDAVRREMFGATAPSADYGQAIYHPRLRVQVYEEMFRRADVELEAGRSVILDGTFLSADSRRRAVAVANRRQALPLVIHCHCPEAVALKRIARRAERGESLSQSHPAVYRRQKQDEEGDVSTARVQHVETTARPADLADQVWQWVKSSWLEFSPTASDSVGISSPAGDP